LSDVLGATQVKIFSNVFDLFQFILCEPDFDNILPLFAMCFGIVFHAQGGYSFIVRFPTADAVDGFGSFAANSLQGISNHNPFGLCRVWGENASAEIPIKFLRQSSPTRARRRNLPL
jgi:hypothetical protein